MSDSISIMGVKIDPSGAVSGRDTAVKAALETADAFKKADASITTSSAHMADSMKKGSQDIQREATKTKNALEDMAKGSAWERMRTSFTATLGPLTQGFSAMLGHLGVFESKAAKAAAAASGVAGSLGTMTTAAGAAGVGMTGLLAAIGPLIAGLAAIGLAIGAVVGSFGLLKEGVEKAAQFETFQVQLATLLGSFDKAKTRLEQLKDFAAKTPFELPEVVKANITLERMTNGALGTTEALRKVGDTSAQVQQPLSEMAMWVGRLYNGLKANAPVGEATQRLAEVGFISMATKNQIEQLQKTGAKTGPIFAEAWAMVEADMKRAENSMELMSHTWSGIMSNISDAWGQLLGALGEPIMLALKPAASDLAALLDGMKPAAAELGQSIAAAVQQLYAAFKVLGSDSGIGLSLTAAFDTATNALHQGIEAAGAIMSALFQRAIYDALKALEVIQKPETWKGLGDALYNAAADFANAIITAMNTVLAKMQNVVSILSPLLGATAKALSLDSMATLAARQPGVQAYLTNGPAPTVPSWSEAWNASAQAQTPAQIEWQKRQAEQLAAIKAAGTAGFNDSQLPKPSTTTANSDEFIQEGKKTNLLAQMQSQAKSIIEGIQTPMEKLQATMTELQTLRDNGLLTIDQFARASTKAKDDYTKAVTEMAVQAATPLQRLMMQWKDLQKAQQEMAASVANSVSTHMTGAIMEMVKGTKSAKEAFDDMATAILADITEMIVKMLVQYAIQSALGMVGVSSPAPATLSTGQTVGYGKARVHHTGGVVGEDGSTRWVTPSDMAHANRYATGGKITGVGSGERPAILEPGETVLTKDQAADIRARLGQKPKGETSNSSSGQNVTILNVMDMREVENHLAANPGVLINIMSRERSRIKAALQ